MALLLRWALAVLACWGAGVVAPPARAETSYLPLPEIIVDPNEGTTLGLLGVVLMADEHKEIRRIIAPDIRFNSIFGAYPTFRYFAYPDATQRYFLSAGKSTKIDEYFEASYEGKRLGGGPCSLAAGLLRDLDSRERFFGVGNDTPNRDESNYTGDVVLGRISLGFDLPDDLRLTVGTRVRRVRVRRGGVGGLPFAGDWFPAARVPGLEGATVVGQSVGAWYDTRDFPDMPSEGSLLGVETEVVDRALGSSVSFGRVALEGRSFQPLREDRRLILAVRGFAQYLVGGDRVPFYELSSLGGVSSLRGFGTHRYRDHHRVGAQFELRADVHQRDILGVVAHLELTPFLDVGKVFDFSREPLLTDLHAVAGLAVRVVVRPQVVAYVDTGLRQGGVATFTGIDYPY